MRLDLRTIRLNAKLSEEQLGARADLSGGMISRAESGERQLSLEAALRVMHALGLTLPEARAIPELRALRSLDALAVQT